MKTTRKRYYAAFTAKVALEAIKDRSCSPAPVNLASLPFGSAQCRLLSISRSAYYDAPAPETGETLTLMAVINAKFMDWPWVIEAIRWPAISSALAVMSGAARRGG